MRIGLATSDDDGVVVREQVEEKRCEEDAEERTQEADPEEVDVESGTDPRWTRLRLHQHGPHASDHTRGLIAQQRLLGAGTCAGP